MLLTLPFLAWGQDDDMYIVTKKNAKSTQTGAGTAKPNYGNRNVQIVYVDDEADGIEGISGSNRDVDEYNRRYSSRQNGQDTLYAMPDSAERSAQRMMSDVYAQGYDEGYAAGQDYAYSQRLSRFGYGSVYASPWYYSYYSPYYYDPFWGVYDPYWYGGWTRPYWGYAGWGWSVGWSFGPWYG